MVKFEPAAQNTAIDNFNDMILKSLISAISGSSVLYK